MKQSFKDGTFQLGILVGVLVCTLLFTAWLTYHGQIGGNQHSGGALERPANQPHNLPKGTPRPELHSHAQTEVSPSDPKYYEHYDLRAQESMAKSTEAIVTWTKVSLVLGVIGSFFLLWTLWETRKGVQIAERHMFASERPWIELVTIKLGGPLLFEDPPKIESSRVKVIMHIKNIGKSPALRIRIDLKLTIRNRKNLLDQQAQFAEEIRDSLKKAKGTPAIVFFENTMFQGRELETIEQDVWMDTADLKIFRDWTEKTYPDPIALMGIIGCITYETAIDRDFHQTAIIRDLVYWPTRAKDGGRISLRGIYMQETLMLTKSEVGNGPIT